jgi:Fe-S-cluster-containing dehydrogenase component
MTMSNQDSNHNNPDAGTVDETIRGGYWMSLAEVEAGSPTSVSSDEFHPDGDGNVVDPMSRRNFFHLMGASMALAGVAGAGCKRYEKDEIVPLARRPEEQIPGNTQQYASSFELGGVAHSLLVTSYEGRPIHIDGNPEHPFSGSSTDPAARHAGSSAYAQASVLHLYDPDRDPAQSRTLPAGKGITLDGLQSWWTDAKKISSGAAIRVLAEASSSPTLQALKRRFLESFPGAQWHEYEALSWDNERVGTKMAFGRPLRPMAHLERAETIVTLDADIFVEHPAALRYSKDFARSRRPDGTLGGDKMNRLWSVESAFTNTGALADHRLPLRSELILPLVMALDAAIAGGAGPNAEFLKETSVAQFVSVLAQELRERNGFAVLVAGRRQPAAVHAMVAKINSALGAVGKTVSYIEDADPERISHLESIKALAADMATGSVKSLLMIGGNPIFDAPADLNFAAALAKVAGSVHLAEYANETSVAATSFMPRTHYLEAWGDARAYGGTITLAQPLIAPLYGAISSIEFVSALLGEPLSGEALLKKQYVAVDWRQAVHDGFIIGSNLPVAVFKAGSVVNSVNANLTPTQLAGSVRKNGELEITFVPSSASYDGRFANNAWLQETPDFLTKVTWDNYALVAPGTAIDLGLKNDTLITVSVGATNIKLPCYVMPGQARGSIGLVLGGGRTKAGVVGGLDKKQVGFNTYPLRTVAGFDMVQGATVKATGESFQLANVQEHWDFRAGLKGNIGEDEIAKRLPVIVKEIPLNKFADHTWKAEEDEGFFKEEKRGLSLFEEKEYKGHRWAMSIDLGNCTGCNSCMVACQSENNIPVVGKEQVIKNREMSWIRIDRYFSGSPDNPQIVHQPVGCQQCENAPCEQVCPVGATVHSDEGLNDMAYNRCVGTRYCLNNCPYRVRRFNFLDYHKDFTEARNKVRKLLFNPEVTVRARGVMEKCSFCTQRIQNAKIKHKSQIRLGLVAGSASDIQGPLPDGSVVTACQAACPTEAIVFGDLMDKESRVSKLHEDRRSYDLLPDLYTKPRNRFMARVRNPNPAMPGAKAPGGHAASGNAAAPSERGGH